MKTRLSEAAIDRALDKIKARRLKQRRTLLEAIQVGNRWAIQVARIEMGLRHWHSQQQGILVGTRATGCPLC